MDLRTVINCAKFGFDWLKGFQSADVWRSVIPIESFRRPVYCIALMRCNVISEPLWALWLIWQLLEVHLVPKTRFERCWKRFFPHCEFWKHVPCLPRMVTRMVISNRIKFYVCFSRYTSKKLESGTAVYAISLLWPKDNTLTLAAATATPQTTVSMLGYEGTLNWKSLGPSGGIVVSIPQISVDQLPCQWAWVFKLEYLAF